MIDEKTLHQRLTDAAEAQDDLLPRALTDDLKAGRRRLFRRRLLAGASATAAAAAVAIAAVGLTGPLRESAQVEPPTADQDRTATERAAADAAAVEKQQGFDALMQSLLVRHFDPQNKHLDRSSGRFLVETAVGSHRTSHKVGWNVPGDRGQGMLLVQLSHVPNEAMNTCGSYAYPAITCQPLTLPNGRPALIGHGHGVTEISYVQPDGELAYVAVDRLFGNNTNIPVASVGITDAQLIAFVTDPRLNLPPLTSAEQADEDKLKDFAPAPEVMEAAAARHLPGTLHRDRVEDTAIALSAVEKWANGAAVGDVEISVTASVRPVRCPDELSVPACTPVALPNGAEGNYAEGARTYQGGPKYVMGVTYTQPDGDTAAVRILYPGTKRPQGAVTKAQLLALVTDKALDR